MSDNSVLPSAASRGDVIFDAELARRLAELLLEAHYDREQRVRQCPLIVVDKGEQWQVDGSWNRDRKIEGDGAFFMSVQKDHGCVTDFGVWGIFHPAPEALAIIGAHRREKKPDSHMLSDTVDPTAPTGMLRLINMARGGVVFDVELARRLGELLLEAHYGKAQLERQQPLMVIDKGEYWQLGGSWNRDRKIAGHGAFFMSVQKFDGRVSEIGVWAIARPNPPVQPVTEAQLRQRDPNSPA